MSVQYTDERLLELSQQHHMDGGGYAFTNTELEPFKSLGCVLWEDPDFSYFTGETPAMANGMSSPVLFFRPNKYNVVWPASYPFPEWKGQMVRVTTGEVYPGMTECDCWGRENEVAGAWEYTGNAMDPARPDCDRCRGLGEFEREGGAYAVYAFVEDAVVSDHT